MAKYAKLVKENGEEIIVYGKDMREADRNKTFLCAGKAREGGDREKECRVPLCLVCREKKENYFSVKGDNHHIQYCEFSEKAKDKLVSHMDQVASGKQPEDILDSILKTANRTGKRDDELQQLEGQCADADDYQDEKYDLKIRKTLKHPKNAEDLKEILTGHPLDYIYANQAIYRWLINNDTFDYYDNGIDNMQVAMVYLEKSTVIPEDKLQYAKTHDYYVFPCRLKKENNERIMYFFVPRGGEFSKILFSENEEKKQFAVVAAWMRVEGDDHSYFCERVSKKSLCFR